MKPETTARIVVAVALGVGAWIAYRKVTGAAASALDALAALPGQAVQAVADAAQALVDGTAIVSTPWGDVPVSDKNGGGFIKESPNAGRMPDWKNTRDVTPLIAYFRAVGNTATARAQATLQGWTADEIGLAVASMGPLLE